MSKLAVVLFNLGGPDSLQAVEPFLYNLFSDRAIIGLPQPLRFLVAKIISSRRAPIAREIYALMGGRSPILPETLAQAQALELAVNQQLGEGAEARVFIAMRYWHPRAGETASEIRKWGADQIVTLPLYPQYSSTTTGSSLTDWKKAADSAGLRAISHDIRNYPTDLDFISAHVALLKEKLALFAPGEKKRVLFSAHGLPKRVIERGDPYQKEIEATCSAIVGGLEGDLAKQDLDWAISYQSRVGPLEWIGPSTHDEITRAGGEAASLIIVPVAFVSEHSETLVELDIEYAKLASEVGVPRYIRVAALGTHPDFVRCMARLVMTARTK